MTNPARILILGSRRDSHVLRVTAALRQRYEADVKVLDHDALEDFALSFGRDGNLELRTGDVRHNPGLVWIRPKIRPKSGVTFQGHAEGHVRRSQWLNSYREIAACFGERVYNNHQDCLLDYKKFFQMQIAVRCGFRVPVGVISNNRKLLLEFVDARKSSITKSIGASAIMKIDAKGRIFHQSMLTARIDPELLHGCSEESVRCCPALVQEEIEKDFELRIYADRSRVFAISLFSQEHGSTRVDWRIGETFVRKEIFPVTPGLRARLVALIRKLGLAYGVIDVIVDKQGTSWFLECNPEGQWASIDTLHRGALASHIAHDMVHRIGAERGMEAHLQRQETYS